MSAERVRQNVTPMPGPALMAGLDAYIDARFEMLLKRRRLGEPELTAREIRIKAGLTIRQLADKSGVAGGPISFIENGKTKNPYPETLRRLANALGVPEHVYRLAAARGWQGKK